MRWGWPAVLAVLALLAAVAIERRIAAPSGSEAASVVRVSLGDTVLRLRSGYLRPAPEDDAVEIAAFYPGFLPAAGTDDIDAHTDLDERRQRIVVLTLRPADPRLDPADRTARLYLRFLEANGWSHPGGLVSRAFLPGSPFEGDELFYVAPEGRAFAARCPKPDGRRKGADACVAALRSGDLDMDLRFSPNLLGEWQMLAEGARGRGEAARR